MLWSLGASSQDCPDGKEALGLAEILYCCLDPDKRLLISRLDKHTNTIESDSAAVGKGRLSVCQLRHTTRWSADVCVSVCVSLLFTVQYKKLIKTEERVMVKINGQLHRCLQRNLYKFNF